MVSRTYFLATCVLMALACCVAADESVLTLATTTSTQNSGLLDFIHPDFEAQTGIRVKVVARGTGASLQLAREGNADIVLVHAPDMEKAFVEEGFGVNQRAVMYNDFVVVGPETDPAGVRAVKGAAATLKAIHGAQEAFVSRGDNSGTHAKEQAIWRASGVPLNEKETRIAAKGKTIGFTQVAPKGDWYFSIGQGMGPTLLFATEKQAYTLVDRGTYLAFARCEEPKTDLVVLSEGDPVLMNPYSVIAVNPQRFPNLNYQGAQKYIAWLTSPETQALIASFKVGGEVLFHPSAKP